LCGGGTRLGTDSGDRAVLSRAARRVSQRKERKALAVKRGTLGKGDESGTPQGVSSKGKGWSRISGNTSEGVGTNGVSEVVLAIDSRGATRS